MFEWCVRDDMYCGGISSIGVYGGIWQDNRQAVDSICKFLGDISYPLYAIHYPIMYVFYSWLIEKQLYTLEDTWPVAAVVYFGSIALAYLCLKLYDEPVRRWLGNKFVK